MKVVTLLILVLISLAVLAGKSQSAANNPAVDLFSRVQCGSDIPKALIGRTMTKESDAAVEARHKALGLKDLGGSELMGGRFLSSWLICGSEYVLILDKKSIVRDALQFPEHSKTSPEFIGSCQVNGKEQPGEIIAVLNNEVGAENLSAKSAWKIDLTKTKFVKLATAGMQCPRSGIITADGGN